MHGGATTPAGHDGGVIADELQAPEQLGGVVEQTHTGSANDGAARLAMRGAALAERELVEVHAAASRAAPRAGVCQRWR
jgi:hypothetical protein